MARNSLPTLAPSPTLTGALQHVALRDLHRARDSLEFAINLTPTGADRNMLCDMNIEITRVHDQLLKLCTR